MVLNLGNQPAALVWDGKGVTIILLIQPLSRVE